MRHRILRFVLEVVFRPWSRRKTTRMEGSAICISGLVRTGKSDDDKDLDWILRIVARATSAELESSVNLLCLAQETSEKCIADALHSSCFRRDQGRKATSNTNRKNRRRID